MVLAGNFSPVIGVRRLELPYRLPDLTHIATMIFDSTVTSQRAYDRTFFHAKQLKTKGKFCKSALKT